jgi:ABC-type transport system involved in multi-copper enzyme maturation permease subunit
VVKRSNASLSIGLLAWIFWIILWPALGYLTAKQIRPFSAVEYFSKATDDMWKLWNNADSKATAYRGVYNGKVYEHMDKRVGIINKINNLRNRTALSFWDKLAGVQEYAQTLGKISPYMAYKHALEESFGTGLAGYRKFSSNAKEYQQTLLQYVKEEDKKDKDSFHFICSWHPETWSNKKVDHASVPVFRLSSAKAPGVLSSIIFDIAYLVLLNVLLFLGAYLVFMRKDVT